MMTQRYFLRLVPLLALVGGLLTGCDKNDDPPYTVSDEDRYPTLLSNSLGTATKYAVGETVPLELQFSGQSAPIQEIRIFQRIEPAPDSTVVQTLPAAQAAYSRRKFVDTLVVRVVIPAAPNKARVRFSAVVVSQNGLTKSRAVSIRVAEATPTVRVVSATNVTAPANAPVVTGDVVRFSLLFNENGINAYPELPAAPPAANSVLFNNLDSLVTYVRVGTGAERRFARQRLPAATGTQSGAAFPLDVNVTLPTGTAGQDVVFRFEAKSRYLGTPNFRASSVTAAPITLSATTPLAAVRARTLTYTGTTGGDLAALDLTTFATVAAAAPAATKDLVISSTASNAVQFRTLSPGTGMVRSTAAIYTAATFNSLRYTYNNAASTAQVTTLDNIVVGDVIILKLRGTDQYAVVQVTGINRTSATDVVVSLNIKAV
ncbi:hypothetical protein ACFST9_24105 [Hymenobacter monticola]|uniref:Uncharacterized protein n=1 Tax=Hymenobacter monticola TaxID=1705399 RepID=A0ABY4B3U2_9BACT|nr:hypothetical protein [Hymenobacter monticola]UOE33816.1 hypothetical protein MTP16_22220 [Hymenobacter monticola]